MAHNPFFSVIIPVYNVAPYLRVCLDSLVRAWETWAEASATPPDAECICIDDGSTDGCGAILDEYVERFGKGLIFRVFHQHKLRIPVSKAYHTLFQFNDSRDRGRIGHASVNKVCFDHSVIKFHFCVEGFDIRHFCHSLKHIGQMA